MINYIKAAFVGALLVATPAQAISIEDQCASAEALSLMLGMKLLGHAQQLEEAGFDGDVDELMREPTMNMLFRQIYNLQKFQEVNCGAEPTFEKPDFLD
jgi:hypothetical protein